MEIVVEGNGKISVKPDNITLSFDFSTKENTYEKALTNGTKNVELYFELLKTLGFIKEQIKTVSFKVAENKYYDEQTRKYVADGYVYTQHSNLKFDYDMNRLAEIMEKTAKVEYAPAYRISFGVKDNEVIEKELLGKAYNNALFQAEAISKACGKTKSLVCKKISFQPFNEALSSNTRFETMTKMSCDRSISDSINHIFVPEDVMLKKTVYCLFDAE